MNVDEVRVGGYQILTLILLSVNFIIVGMSHALSIFYKYKPDFQCQDDVMNGTSTGSGCPSASACNGTTTIDVNVVVDGSNRTSVASEWLLICDREPLLRASSDVYFGGMMLGALVSGFLMDRIGRMPILAICLYAQGTMGVALNIVKHYRLFLVFRGLQGFFMQGLESGTYVLAIELFPSKYRALVSLIVLAMRSVGFAALAGLSYVILDWRVLQLVVSIPTALTVLYIWLIPESVRWLLSRARTTDAEMVIERIDKYNNLISRLDEGVKEAVVVIPTSSTSTRKMRARNDVDVENNANDEEEEAENLLEPTVDVQVKAAEGSKIDLNADEIASLDDHTLASKETLSTEVADHPKIGKRRNRNWIGRFFEARFIGRTCLILVCLWFACSIAFHSLITLPPRMKVGRHTSLAIAGAMELVTFLFGYLLISSRCGRRGTLCVGQITAASVCVVVAVLAFTLSQQISESIAHGKLMIIKIGAVANIICFFVLRIFTIELLPTIARGTGLGLCIAAEMFGGLITPLMLMLNNYVAEEKLDVSRISMGFFCICVAFFTLILPETLSLNALPDAVEDAQTLNRKSINEKINNEQANNGEQSKNSEKLRKKLFSEDWVDAGNGIIVNFTENKTAD